MMRIFKDKGFYISISLMIVLILLFIFSFKNLDSKALTITYSVLAGIIVIDAASRFYYSKKSKYKMQRMGPIGKTISSIEIIIFGTLAISGFGIILIEGLTTATTLGRIIIPILLLLLSAVYNLDILPPNA